MSYRPPANACCTAGHIYGPFAKFPITGPRSSPELPLETFVAMLDALGLDRGVLTQPSHYQENNACLLDALPRAKGRIRGVVSLPPAALTDAEITRLEGLGIRGVRIFGRTDIGAVTIDNAEAIAERIKGRNWHIELVPGPEPSPFASMRSRIEKLGVPVVFGQMAGPDIAKGVNEPSFAAVVGMLHDGLAWVKLSLWAGIAAPYKEATPFARALVEANPDQVLFGLGGPHTEFQNDPKTDLSSVFPLLEDWVPDEKVRERILVANPARLYRF